MPRAAADFENPAGVVGLDAVDGGVDPLGHLVLDVFRARPAGDDGIEAVEFLAAGLVDGGLIEEIPLVLPDTRAVGAGGISEIGDEAAVVDTGHRLFDGGVLFQERFNFSQLDAEAADFHLVIHATEAFQGAVGGPAGEVAGAVKLGAGAERRVDEAVRR